MKNLYELKIYVEQMINSKAEYDKKPLKKILNKINIILLEPTE